jgi:hypothetical protein
MLKLKHPQLFQPKIQHVDDAIALSYDPWDMRVLAYDYEELEHYVVSHVALLWKLLVQTDESNLTRRGQAIRERLLEDFEEATA